MKKILLILLLLLCSLVYADGMMIIHDMDAWNFHPEQSQYVAINYHDGTEHMILSIDSKLHGDYAVWMFPVPASPEESSIDIIKGFPRFHGMNVKDKASGFIEDTFAMARLTQIYTFVMAFGGRSFGKLALEGLVDVHQVVTREGLTSELVSTKDSGNFYNYLESKGLSLPTQDVIDYYVGKDYSFVVSYISNITEYKNRSTRYDRDNLGVYIKFKVDKPFFPLKPTSVYGERHVPAVLYVLGHMEPELYNGIYGSQVEYMHSSYFSVKPELMPFFDGMDINTIGTINRINDLKYTKVKIDVASKYYTEDLWFDLEAPLSVKSSNFVIDNYSQNYVYLIILLLSILSSTLAGLIVYKNFKYWWFGIFNLLSFYFLMVMAYVMGESDAKKTLLKCIKKTSLMVLFIPLVWIYLEVNYLSQLYEIIPIALMTWFFLTAAFTPFVYGYYNNRKVLKFTLLFSFMFVGLSYLFQILFVLFI